MADEQNEKTQVRRETEHHAVLQAGLRVGRYEIKSVLGQGGFGITYLAHDTQLERDVAIKEYLPTLLAVRDGGTTVLPRSTEMADDFSWGRQRFLDEAKTLARLAHAPAVVHVFDYLEAHGTAYAVMQLVRGETLASRLKREMYLPQAVLERILFPLLDGLEQVHTAGFLHRDIKPANIIVAPDDAPTLIDFGASRAAIVDRSQAMTAVFTPGFAAIEQFTSGKQGPWTDIYALAATLYACIAGRAPVSAIDRVVENEFIPATTEGAGRYAPDFLRAIDSGLAVKANDRPQTISDWRAIFANGRAAADDKTVAMNRSTVAEKPSGPTRTKSRKGLLVFSVGVLVAVLGYVGFRYSTTEGQRAAEARTADVTQVVAQTPSSLPVDAQASQLAETEARLKQLEETARQLEASRKAAEAEKAKAEEDAQRAAALQQQQAEAKARADAERKAEEAAREKPADDEAALRLSPKDRQRIQVALASLGFDIGGADGNFGPRSRQMIAAWQQKNSFPATGFISAAQNAALLHAAAGALARWEEEQKKLDDAIHRKSEEDAARKAVSAAPSAATTGTTTAFDGNWNVTLTCPDYNAAKGYSQYLAMKVTNGAVVAQRGQPGTPGSLTITGQIQADGTAQLQAAGHTASSAYTIGNVPSGSRVSYSIAARFNGARGTGTRTQQRPCDLAFVKN